ncbi:hypothetical protein QCA50_001441 [Cerrena zonata]|uniref:EthD domain-containing protein n=1 Tax=Cerrena zonata TaxID=2478898 RepID=A0AAW0GX69_9APHY
MTIRVTCLIRRQPHLTREEFSERWGKNHAAIFTSLKAVKENLVKYNQFHVLDGPSKELEAIGLPLAPYDGAAEFEVEKLSDLLALFGDEEYLQKAVPDEPNFLDRTSVQVLVGENQTKWQKPSA